MHLNVFGYVLSLNVDAHQRPIIECGMISTVTTSFDRFGLACPLRLPANPDQRDNLNNLDVYSFSSPCERRKKLPL